MPIDPDSATVLTAYSWVPPFVHGLVRDLRVRWACEEAGIAYAENLIDVRAKPEGFAALQPWSQVPAMHIDDLDLFESGAILLYLCEKDARLMPAKGQPRADAMCWTVAALNSVEPMVMEMVGGKFFASEEGWWKEREPQLIEALGIQLDPVAERLENREWLAGEFSVADIAMAHILDAISRMSKIVATRPSLSAYLDRAKARPAYIRALADQMAAYERGS